MRLTFIVSGQPIEIFTPRTRKVSELIDAALMMTGNFDNTDAPWEARTVDGQIIEPEEPIGYYYAEGEIGDLCGEVFLNPTVGAGAASGAV